MGLTLETSVPIITVFLQGLISFFSPCILPLVPLYISYLAGGAKIVAPDGTITYPRKQVMVNTIFFVTGISFTFVVLGFGFSALGQFFNDNRILFARISGIIMIFFGLYQLGVFGQSYTLEKEHRLPFHLNRLTMGPIPAFLLGFTFSFAWTPCVGPVLGSVLLMASSATSSINGFLLIAVFTVGFILPFLAVGLFTTRVLQFFKDHQNVLRYSVKIGALLLIFMGVMTATGFMNGFTNYLSSFGVTSESTPPSEKQEPETTPNDEEDIEIMPSMDFTLVDQYGETHTLSDYKGQTVFLNFWATWCPPCKQEMPYIEELYQEYGYNKEDVVILGIAAPNLGQESDIAHITNFLEENEYTFPVVMDEDGSMFQAYGLRSFPTTFMIDTNGNVFGYVPSALPKDTMINIIEQTQNSTLEKEAQ